MPPTDPWFDETEEQKEVRRQAAAKFLIATKDNAQLRQTITTDDNEAKRQFELLGGITLPAGVRVICLEPDRDTLAKLVVFRLLDSTAPTPEEPYKKAWLAAWPPYK